MAPSVTTCTVPLEVSQAAPQGFLMFSAYGPEANFVHPPRPADARTPWNQEWVAKVRFKSGMMGALGQNGTGIGAMAGMAWRTSRGMADLRAGGRRRSTAPSCSSWCGASSPSSSPW